MHVLGVFEMEYNHLNFVELECGVGFGISTWGFWCLLWNVNVSKFEVGCCIVGTNCYTMILIFYLFAIGMFCLLWMGVGVCCGFRHNTIAHGQNLFWKWSSTLLVMFIVFVICFCNWALDFFCEIVMLENLVLQFKFSSFVVHWSSSFMHFAFLWIAKCFF